MQFERKEAGRDRQRDWLVFLASLSLAFAVLATLHSCGVQICLFHKLTGLPCPVCGSSRALFLMIKGEFNAAFHLQPLASIAMIAGGCGGLVYSYMLVFRRVELSVNTTAKERRLAISVVLLVIAANWVYLLLHAAA